jgi:hypothetical protein
MSADLTEPTGKQTITCPSMIPAAATGGKIIVSISYRPEWWPFRKQKHKHFVTAKDKDGKFVWFEQPMPNVAKTGAPHLPRRRTRIA